MQAKVIASILNKFNQIKTKIFLRRL